MASPTSANTMMIGIPSNQPNQVARIYETNNLRSISNSLDSFVQVEERKLVSVCYAQYPHLYKPLIVFVASYHSIEKGR